MEGVSFIDQTFFQKKNIKKLIKTFNQNLDDEYRTKQTIYLFDIFKDL